MIKWILCVLLLSSSTVQADNTWLSNQIAQQEETPHVATKQSFFTTHGFILFYGSQCPHCKAFAPVLKRFASLHHANVLPLSLDNQALPEFPRFLPASTEWLNVAFQGNPISYPALFVVNQISKTLYPVSFGSMSIEELDERMNHLILRIKDYESKRGSNA